MQVFAKAHSDHEEIGEIEITALSPRERLQMVALRSGTLFLLAIAAVFIPILHFILVPALLLASVLAGLSAWRFQSKIKSGKVKCPHCTRPIEVQPAPLSWPILTVCQNCASSVRLYQTSQKA